MRTKRGNLRKNTQKTIRGETTKNKRGKTPSPEGKIQPLKKSMGSLQNDTNLESRKTDIAVKLLKSGDRITENRLKKT